MSSSGLAPRSANAINFSKYCRIFIRYLKFYIKSNIKTASFSKYLEYIAIKKDGIHWIIILFNEKTHHLGTRIVTCSHTHLAEFMYSLSHHSIKFSNRSDKLTDNNLLLSDPKYKSRTTNGFRCNERNGKTIVAVVQFCFEII